MEYHVKCPFCDKTYVHKKHMYNHVRKINQREPFPDKCFVCGICEKRFVTKQSLLVHTNTFHQDDSITNRTNQCRIICPFEDWAGMHIELEEIMLNRMTEFQKWKCEMEQKSVSQYVRNRKSSTLIDGSTKSMYYCNQSHNYIKRESNIRDIKSMASNKMGFACPSFIEITGNNGTISVKYWKTHCGHGSEELGQMKHDVETRT